MPIIFVRDLDKIQFRIKHSDDDRITPSCTFGVLHSKRLNRGLNPRYQQDSYYSFSTMCGQKRKQPEASTIEVLCGQEMHYNSLKEQVAK